MNLQTDIEGYLAGRMLENCMQVKNMLTYVVSSATGTADLVCFLVRMLPCETAHTGGGSPTEPECTPLDLL